MSLRTGEKSDFSDRYIQRHPAIFENRCLSHVHSACFHCKSQPHHHALQEVPSCFLTWERRPCCVLLRALQLRVALACLLDKLNEMRAVSTFSTHICPQQRLPYANTQSWLTGRAGPAEEACVGVLNGIIVLEWERQRAGSLRPTWVNGPIMGTLIEVGGVFSVSLSKKGPQFFLYRVATGIPLNNGPHSLSLGLICFIIWEVAPAL